jgi:dihydrofolate synthase/folylpolyglutamate synthase
MGYFPKTHAVFGAMADKDLTLMLGKINPLVDSWYFSDLPTPRGESSVQLLAKWRSQNTRGNATAAAYPDPRHALQAAIDSADPADRIIVFGSFYTVGGILKDGVPRLHAKHLNS